MSPIPRHVADHLELTTGLPADHLAGTRAIPRPCPDCARLTLTGYTGKLLALLATVDPYALTTHQEAAAVILARPTYRLWGTPHRYELTNRHQPRLPPWLTYPPADTPGVTVVAEHHCHTPPLGTTPIPLRPPRTAINHDAPIPF